MTPRLETQRLILREKTPADAADLFAIFGDPRVARYWSSPPWESVDVAVKKILSDAQANEQRDGLTLGIELKSEGKLIGVVNLHSAMWSSRRAEIGYAINADYWQMGYVTEALTAMLDYAFEELNLNRIEADIDPRNAASEKSLLKLGFRLEGILRERWIVQGEVSDTGLYGLLREEWMIQKVSRAMRQG